MWCHVLLWIAHVPWDGRFVILSREGVCFLEEVCWMQCIVWDMFCGFARMFLVHLLG